MSDSLTDAQKIIDRVLEDCYPVFDPDGHINGTVPGRGAWDCHCGMVVNTTEAEVRAHVTVEIDKALGGLTREYKATFSDGSEFGCWDKETYEELVSHHSKTKTLLRGCSRFVGGWTPEAGQ